MQVWVDQPAIQTCNAVGDKLVRLPSLPAKTGRLVSVRGLKAPKNAGAHTLRVVIDSTCKVANNTDNNGNLYQVQKMTLRKVLDVHIHVAAHRPHHAHKKVSSSCITLSDCSCPGSDGITAIHHRQHKQDAIQYASLTEPTPDLAFNDAVWARKGK
jgi:hypothetical protein